MRSSAASPAWFAHHEFVLAWRDWVALMSGGRKLRDRAIVVSMAIFAVLLHGLAYAVMAPNLTSGAEIDVATLAMVSTSIVLTFTMMLSQAMESVTRAFYARDDVELILSSPASACHLFTVRIAMMVLTTAAMSGLMVSPFINVAVVLGGVKWLAAYPVIFAFSALAVGCAVVVTLLLFRALGAKRTRLAAQILAAVVGASFVIGIQVVAIVSYGGVSRFSVLSSPSFIASLPDAASLVWLPAHAATGNPYALVLVILAGLTVFAWAAMFGAVRFQTTALSAISLTEGHVTHVQARRSFRPKSAHAHLIYKELRLLGRDPWLVSQSLMQVLYLIPPALMLWVNFGARADVSVILAPVIVMAIGQLAGGLAWLTVSGEDAPDLVATAPVPQWTMMSAKVSAVLVVVAVIVAPLVIALAALSPWGAGVTLLGALAAALAAIVIQLWFRAQCKRSNFRRRQVASKVSTFCEAFASISCAATAAVAAAGSMAAVVPALGLLLVMLVAWLLSPARE